MTAPTLFGTVHRAEAPSDSRVRLEPWLGKCPAKGCRAAHRAIVTLERYRIGRDRFGNERHEWAPTVVRDHKPRRTDYYNVLPELYCTEHRRALRFRAVAGTYSEARRCDTRCTSATGPKCECQCAGANHGTDHG